MEFTQIEDAGEKINENSSHKNNNHINRNPDSIQDYDNDSDVVCDMDVDTNLIVVTDATLNRGKYAHRLRNSICAEHFYTGDLQVIL